jgi:CubicO group peptidase (beta-lactamase class C family)
MELYGVHVYRRGAEPVERRLRSDDRENLCSVSKTFTSVALGIAEAEGRLALDDPAHNYFPEFKKSAAPGLERVTLRHLLTMTSGSPHSWSASEPVEVPTWRRTFSRPPSRTSPAATSATPAPDRTWRPARCAPRPAPASATT